MRRGRLPVSLCTKRGSTKGLGRVRQKDRKSGDHASYKISVLSIVWLPFQPLVSIVFKLPLLLLLSRFSRVRLCATPKTAAHQAPPSLGLSRQEYWSGLPFPSPMHESEKWKWSRSVMSDSSWPHGLQPTRLLHPWDSPGKSKLARVNLFPCNQMIFNKVILPFYFKIPLSYFGPCFQLCCYCFLI